MQLSHQFGLQRPIKQSLSCNASALKKLVKEPTEITSTHICSPCLFTARTLPAGTCLILKDLSVDSGAPGLSLSESEPNVSCLIQPLIQVKLSVVTQRSKCQIYQMPLDVNVCNYFLLIGKFNLLVSLQSNCR